MSSDIPTRSIQQLIDACQEQWANVGEGVLNLIWHPSEGDIFDVEFDKSMRDQVTSLYLTADNGEICEGIVTIPRMGLSWRYFGTNYEAPNEIEFFDSIARPAGAFVISRCRKAVEPYLMDGGRGRNDPMNWWVAYLWFRFGDVPKTKVDQKELQLDGILILTIQALQQIDREVPSPVAPSIDSVGSDTGRIQNGEDREAVAGGETKRSHEQPTHEYIQVTKKALRLVLKITANTLRKRIREGEIPMHPDDLLDDKKNARSIRVEVAWYKTQQSNTQ
jgi:hypothetical protein